eukprot:ANDGO_06232.mRNA.1 hypothetical protein PPTG_02819
MSAESSSIPQLQPYHSFGVTGEDFANNFIYSREDTIMYSTGRHLCFQNVETRLQKLILPSDSCKRIVSFSVSYGNRYIAICEQVDHIDKRVDVGIYKLANMKKLRTLVYSDCFSPTVCAFSKNGKYLVTCGSDDDGTVLMWDWDKVKVLGMAKLGETPIRRVVVNPFLPEAVLVSGSRTMKVLRLTETSATTVGSNAAHSSGPSPDNKVSNSSAGALSLGATSAIAPLNYPLMASFVPSFLGVINDHVWISSTQYIVASTDSTLRVFDGRSEIRKIENLFPEGHSVRCLKSLSSGGLIVCGDRGFFSILQPATKDAKTRDAAKESAVETFTMSRSKQQKSQSKDDDVRSQKSSASASTTANPNIRADGSAGFLTESRRLRTTNRETILGTALSQSEDYVCFWEESQSLAQFNLSEIDLVREEEGAKTTVVAQSHRGRVNSIDIAVHRPVMVSTSFDCSCRIWDSATKQQMFLRVFPEEPLCAAIHPSGNMIAVAFRRKLVFFALTMNDLLQIHEMECKGCKVMRFSHGGHYLACISGTTFWVVSTISFMIQHVMRGHIGPIRSVVWSNDDERAATAGYDGAVYEWDVLTGRKVQEFVDKAFQFTGVLFVGSRSEQSGTVQPSREVAVVDTADSTQLEIRSSEGSSREGGNVTSARSVSSSHLAPSTLVVCGIARDYSSVRRIENGQVAEDVKFFDIQITRGCAFMNGNAIIFGTHNGLLIVVPVDPRSGQFLYESKYSFSEDPDMDAGEIALPPSSAASGGKLVASGFAESKIVHRVCLMHADSIRVVMISYGDQYVFTGGEEGALAINTIYQPASVLHNNAFMSSSQSASDSGEAAKVDKESAAFMQGAIVSPLDAKIVQRFEQLAVVLRAEYQESQTRIADLEEQVIKTKQELTIRLREREKELMDDARESRQQYDKDLERKMAEMDALRIARIDSETMFRRQMEQNQSEHLRIRTEIENSYELKLVAANTVIAQLEEAKDEEKVRFEDTVTSMQTEHMGVVEELKSNYEAKLMEAQERYEALQDDLNFLKKQHAEEVRALFDEQEVAVSQLHHDARRDLDKQKEAASSLKSEAVYMRNKFAQNRQEVENLRAVVRQRDSTVSSAEREIGELQTTVSSLRREVHQRDESLVDKERLINDLKKRNQELEKFRLVFGYKLHGLKREMEPKDSQIDALSNQVHEMETEFEKEAQDRAAMEQSMRDKQAQMESLNRELRLAEKREKDRDKYIRQFRTELGRTVSNQDSGDWKESVRQLYRKYVLSDAPYDNHGSGAHQQQLSATQSEDADRLNEWDRQRRFLEQHKSAIARQGSQKEKLGSENAKRKLRENHELMEEVNSLRRQNHELFAQLKQVQSEARMQALSSQAGGAASAMSGGFGGSRVNSAAGRPLSQAQTEFSAGSRPGSATKVRGKIAKGSTIGADPGHSSPSKMRRAGPTTASITALLEQIENNNKLIDMQRYEIKRLREQVQYLLEKTKQFVNVSSFDDDLNDTAMSAGASGARALSPSPADGFTPSQGNGARPSSQPSAAVADLVQVPQVPTTAPAGASKPKEMTFPQLGNRAAAVANLEFRP